jgi:cytochrome oxidase assembly protein ShyY1
VSLTPNSPDSITRDYFRTGFKRWIRWIAVAVVFAIACGFLANWQWNRRVQVVKVITRLDRNYSHSVQPLAKLVPSTAGFSLRYEYRPALVTGHFDSSKLLLLRNQINNGNPGFDLLVPFVTDAGTAIVVDRGWVSVGAKQDSPDFIPPIPTGPVKLVGRLIHYQQPDSRTAPMGQAMSITPIKLNDQWRYPAGMLYQGAYLRLAVESPRASSYGILSIKPDISEGNHLSYAFQWILFALLGFAAIGANIRQDLREKRAASDPNYVAPVRKRKRLGDSDKEAEDALLDG